MKKFIQILPITIILLLVLCSCSGFSDIFSNLFSKEITAINLSDTNLTLTTGDSKTLEVTVEPDEAEAKKLTWTTSDKSVATVSDGEVKAKKSGSAVIKVEAENGISQSCDVTVVDKEIEGITLSNPTATIREGKTIQLEASVTPVDAPVDGLVWSSSDEKIATVNDEGYVKGIKTGVASITCRAQNGTEAACTIIVKENPSPTTAQQYTTEPTTQGGTQKATEKSKSDNEDDFVLPYSSERKITDAEAASLSSQQAQEAINEIYARNGYIFTTESIQSYFESKSWYSPDSSFSPSDLSSIESYNVGVLSSYR